MEILRRCRAAGLAVLLALTACAQAVPGMVVEPDTPPCLAGATNGPPSTPTDAPVITVDDQVSYWLQNGHTAPLGLAVYADGTVIQAEAPGELAEPLPAMVIGRIDMCRVRRAAEALSGLADADFGEPGVTDQGVTTVTVNRPGSDPLVLSVYALGIGDEYVNRAQAAVRAELTAAIDDVTAALTAVEPWTPTRLRVTRFERAPDGTARSWPLTTPIADVLDPGTDRRLACGVLAGSDAAAVTAALAGGPVLSSWDDGDAVVTLAVAVLVPGQPGCGR